MTNNDNNYFGYGSLEALQKAVDDGIMHPIVLKKRMQTAQGRKEQAGQALSMFFAVEGESCHTNGR